MEYKEIQSLIKLIDSTDLTEFKMKEGDFELMIRTKDYFKLTKNIKSQVIQTPVVQATHAPVAPVSPAEPVAPAAPVAKEESGSAAAPAEGASAANIVDIKSPIVGTFYRSPSPDKDAYVKIGDRIEAGDIVCIVEAMKLFNEIESEISGKIVEIVAEDSTPVEYDQVLFRVEQ